MDHFERGVVMPFKTSNTPSRELCVLLGDFSAHKEKHFFSGESGWIRGRLIVINLYAGRVFPT